MTGGLVTFPPARAEFEHWGLVRLREVTGGDGPFRLDLGAGTVRTPDGYVRLDANPRTNPDLVAIVPPIPLPDACCSHVRASHFLEHLTNDDACVLMAEVWRVLIPDGEFEIICPFALSRAAFQDPTHRSYWVPEKLHYFTPQYRYLGYDLETRFSLVRQRMVGVDAFTVTLRKERG